MVNKQGLVEVLKKMDPSEGSKADLYVNRKAIESKIDATLGNISYDIAQTMEKHTLLMGKLLSEVVNAIRGHDKAIADHIETLADSFDSYAGGRKDLAPYFGDLGVRIAEGNKHSKTTSDLIRNLKWNSTMGVKDENGTPINPSIAPFNITSPHDFVELAYTNNNITSVIYRRGGATGNIVARLALTYDTSNNISTVTRT